VTVADRCHTGTAGPIASGLTALLETARGQGGPRRLIWVSLPAAPLDPIELFSAARALDLEAALWLQPAAGRSVVGIGRAWAVEVGGPDRFSEATAAWRALLADARSSGTTADLPESGPRLLGGLGFTGRTPSADDPWAAFGPASLVLPTSCLARTAAGTSLTVAFGPDQPEGLDGPAAERLERQWDDLAQTARAARDAATTPEPGALHLVDQRPDRAGWDRTVGLYAGAVGRGRIDKVVLARRVVLRADTDLDVTAALRSLARSAPESTTFAFVRGGTTFLGATPERLVQTVGRSFETVAMAGSVARGRDSQEDARFAAALLASEKDREEHAVVVEMLRASLAPIVEVLDIADSPTVAPLRHLQHLVTPISGRLRDEAGLLALAQRLHPTPAVGGAPREVALALIAEHEAFERGWYAGPIGWLGADGDGELMVALRCALVSGPQATLFAGCGIVADSDPAREWEESRLKLRTMTSALGRAVEDDR
jgi:isochorismate synthase